MTRIIYFLIFQTVFAQLENFHDGVCEKSEVLTYKRFPPDESLNQFDQDDPKLVEIVRSLLIQPPPDCQPYNFSKFELDMRGQFNEVEVLEKELFGSKTGGFFIEAGAYDGEAISNTLFFESKMKWTGLLVEPNINLFKEMLTKNRKSHLFGHCLSTKTNPEIVAFDASGVFGGIINEGKNPGDGFDVLDVNSQFYYRRSKFTLQCFPLYTILMALGNPVVDLFILDIEGAEMPVLQTIPWDKVNINVLVVEVHHMGKIFEPTFEEFELLMKESGYTFFKDVGPNQIYIKNDFVPLKVEENN